MEFPPEAVDVRGGGRRTLTVEEGQSLPGVLCTGDDDYDKNHDYDKEDDYDDDVDDNDDDCEEKADECLPVRRW